MKLFLIFLICIATLLAFNMSGSKNITEADLISTLSEYPELYHYDDFVISNKIETRGAEQTRIEFEYTYIRTAKTHIAFVEGDYVEVTNAFVNACNEQQESLDELDESDNECRFITEMGTIEQVQGSDGRVVIEKFGAYSTSNVQKFLLSDNTFNFLTYVLSLFKADEQSSN